MNIKTPLVWLRTFVSAIRKNKKASIGIGIIILVILVSIILGRDKAPEYNSVTVTRQNMRQIVSATGKVKAEQDISLALERSGTLKSIKVKAGDKVSAGDIMAELENAELRAQLAQADATLSREHIKLEELKQGARPEELQIYQTKLTTAENNLQEAKISAATGLETIYANAEDAIRNKINQVFDPPSSYYPIRLKFFSIYPDKETSVRNQKKSIEYLLDDWRGSLNAVSAQKDLTPFLATAEQNLETLKEFSNTMFLLINSVSTSDTNPSATLATWRTDITAARNTLNSSLSTINSTRDSLQSNQLSLQLSQDEYNLKKAGATTQQIQLQELQVQQAQANRQAIAAQMNKTILRAPIAGIITKTEFEIGEIVPANAVFIHMISDTAYIIEAYIPEVEIAKLQAQNKATVTLDAYGESLEFEAVVGSLDSSATVIDGVPTYKTILLLTGNDERIKSGMTANITIITAEKENVLVLPQRSIQRKDGKKFVQVINTKSAFEEREISTGISNTNGIIEITGGLSEGERVLLP